MKNLIIGIIITAIGAIAIGCASFPFPTIELDESQKALLEKAIGRRVGKYVAEKHPYLAEDIQWFIVAGMNENRQVKMIKAMLGPLYEKDPLFAMEVEDLMSFFKVIPPELTDGQRAMLEGFLIGLELGKKGVK